MANLQGLFSKAGQLPGSGVPPQTVRAEQHRMQLTRAAVRH
ncbi:hypothetical protein [Mycobacterium ahvazicum]|nr:hypothetical protein [Mycobacterium ahvazicum]